MAVPGISDTVLSSAFISGQRPAEKRSNHYYIAAMMIYLKALNDIVLNAWRQFAENRQEIAKENKATHEKRRQRHSELEGQRRQLETAVQPYLHRQVTAFCVYDGFLSDHRHLNTPV